MPDYLVKSRKTSAITEETVTADSREQAIAQAVQAAGEGESIEVMHVEEVVAAAAAPAAE